MNNRNTTFNQLRTEVNDSGMVGKEVHHPMHIGRSATGTAKGGYSAPSLMEAMGEPNMKVESKPRGVDRHKYVCFGLVRNWMCVRLIIGEGREKEREGERSVDRLIQSNLGGREGTAMLGTRGGSRRLPTPHTTHTKRSSRGLHSDNSPIPQNPKEFSKWLKRCVRGRYTSATRKTHVWHEQNLDERGHSRPRVGLKSRINL